MTPEKWAERLVQGINERDAQARIREEAFVLKETLRRTNGPSLWSDLREIFKNRVETVNQVAQRDVFVPDLTNFREIRLGHKILARFDDKQLTLVCCLGSRTESFSVRVSLSEGEVCWWSKAMGEQSVEQIAERLIETNC